MNSNEYLQKKIEAVLFALGRPLSRSELSSMLGVDLEELEVAIASLAMPRSNSGVVVVDDGRTSELRADADSHAIIERLRADDYARDIGRAGSEVLAAVMYRGPLARSDIDFIRGVNSSQALRTLLMRGLVRKVSASGNRAVHYEVTTEFLAHLGISRVEDVPEYHIIHERLDALSKEYRSAESSDSKSAS